MGSMFALSRVWIVAASATFYLSGIAVAQQAAETAKILSSAEVAQELQNAFPNENAGAVFPSAQSLDVVAPRRLADVPSPAAGLPRLTATTSSGGAVHIFPTNTVRSRFATVAADTGPMVYHGGGSIMPSTSFYAIFWLPKSGKLQNGKPTSLSALYASLQTRLLQDYPGHSVGTITTQYYQKAGSTLTFPGNRGGLAGVAFDSSPYPPSGCTDTATPGNCISDAQLQAEIKKVMAANHWTGGLGKMFLIYTSAGEGSCSPDVGCAYVQYCAYHGFIPGAAPILYANMPFGDAAICPGGISSPNGFPAADSTLTVASHEITETITDPLLDAWFTAQGNEIGDLCNGFVGNNTWGASANQWWNGHFYELQMEFDNHARALGFGGCQQVGPL